MKKIAKDSFQYKILLYQRYISEVFRSFWTTLYIENGRLVAQNVFTASGQLSVSYL